MSALVVVSHSDRNSLTQHVAHAVSDAIRAAGSEVEFGDLAAENFDPRFSGDDLDLYRGKGEVPADVVAEQERIDRAEHLILVFPMYWWSMPALLKGWIDRVFVNGWAYDSTPGTAFAGMLGHLTVHLVVVAADDEESLERHGIPEAFRTQIERGIVKYCAAKLGPTTFVLESDTKDRDLLAAEVHKLSEAIAARAVSIESVGAGQAATH